ncbi:hypothetical protein C8J56DRAFT_210172 [Mycena floridula]|nr:hypothetical protein C8J56DRAFT_210172 [Mycena floridula]
MQPLLLSQSYSVSSLSFSSINASDSSERRTDPSCLSPFFCSLFRSPKFSLTEHILRAIYVAKEFQVDPISDEAPLSDTFLVMLSWAFAFGDAFLAAALLVHVDRRMINFSEKAGRARVFPLWKRSFDAVMVFVWIVLVIIKTIVFAQLYVVWEDVTPVFNEALYRHLGITLDNLSHAILAFRVVTSFDIAVTSAIIWRQMKKIQFDDANNTKYIAMIVSPTLLIRTLYMVVLHIIEFTAALLYSTFDQHALYLAETIFYYTTGFVITYAFLRAAWRPKQFDKKMDW